MEAQPFSNEPVFPRVLGNRLPRNNSSVTVVGMITHLDQQQRKLTLEVDPTSKQTVDVTIPSTEPAQLRQLKFIEVRGFSNEEGYVQMKDYSNFQDSFDLKAYNDVIKLTSQSAFKSIFGY